MDNQSKPSTNPSNDYHVKVFEIIDANRASMKAGSMGNVGINISIINATKGSLNKFIEVSNFLM